MNEVLCAKCYFEKLNAKDKKKYAERHFSGNHWMGCPKFTPANVLEYEAYSEFIIQKQKNKLDEDKPLL